MDCDLTRESDVGIHIGRAADLRAFSSPQDTVPEGQFPSAPRDDISKILLSDTELGMKTRTWWDEAVNWNVPKHRMRKQLLEGARANRA